MLRLATLLVPIFPTRLFGTCALRLLIVKWNAQDSFFHRALWDESIRISDGFLLVYSITSRDSFEEISKLHREIIQLKGSDPSPVVLVGNKCDLDYARQVGMDGENQAVLYSLHCLNFLSIEGRDLATHLGCEFIETSPKYDINVDEAFYTLVRAIKKRSKVRFNLPCCVWNSSPSWRSERTNPAAHFQE
jgi:GTPase SAR1 family protein